MVESGIRLASCTLDELFRNIMVDIDGMPITGKLTIPDYQRAYVWKEKELKTLLADFKEYDFSNKSNDDGKPKPQYYLGSVIVHLDGDKLNIIDGQQRITTMALIATIKHRSIKDFTRIDYSKIIEDYPSLALEYHSPESQSNIKTNYDWLEKEKLNLYLDSIDYTRINVTLVITDSEDTAYKFFETQNTGGIRLDGADIIKAHHLRVIQKLQGSDYANQTAKKWESMKHVADKNRNEPLISCLLRGRYWNTLDFKNYPHKGGTALRNAIVGELADSCGKAKENLGFGRHRVKYEGAFKNEEKLSIAYELRQPLNEGENALEYLSYFDALYDQYFTVIEAPAPQTEFQKFYAHIAYIDNYGYMFKCFQTALLIYIAQFGDQHLDVVAKKLFRVIFSLRLSQSRVEARSIPKLLWDSPVFDWIATSYTVEQLCLRLDGFKLKPMKNVQESKQAERFIRYMRLLINPDKNFIDYSFDVWCTEYDEVIRNLLLGDK